MNKKIIQTNNYNIVFDIAHKALNAYLVDKDYSHIFILVDENTHRDCLNLMKESLNFEYHIFEIPSGEENKTLLTAQTIWQSMIEASLDRHALMINIGGGVIGDMGGFCASTYMRGIDFIQVPTTLLSQVDASVGGKLAIDMDAYKNIVGMFNDPQLVLIDTQFLKTLNDRERMSGFAELLKHGLIKDADLWRDLLTYDSKKGIAWDTWVYDSVLIKNEVVSNDPLEKGERKILNFGHTIGHAIESELLHTDQKLLHGEAIAIGMICEAFLSYRKGFLTLQECDEVKKGFLNIYTQLPKILPGIDVLMSRMKLDKKNKAGVIKFTLLSKIGAAVYNQALSFEEIKESFTYYLK